MQSLGRAVIVGVGGGGLGFHSESWFGGSGVCNYVFFLVILFHLCVIGFLSIYFVMYVIGLFRFIKQTYSPKNASVYFQLRPRIESSCVNATPAWRGGSFEAMPPGALWGPQHPRALQLRREGGGGWGSNAVEIAGNALEGWKGMA